MGLSFSSFFLSLVRWGKDKDVRILMLGLDSAGKVKFSVFWAMDVIAQTNLARRQYFTDSRYARAMLS